DALPSLPHARPYHRFALLKTNALLFGELIKLFVLQNFIHPIVEDVPARSWQLSRRDPQWLLPRSFFTHRHRLSSPIATFFTDYGQCWSNYIEYSRLKSRLLPRAARLESLHSWWTKRSWVFAAMALILGLSGLRFRS